MFNAITSVAKYLHFILVPKYLEATLYLHALRTCGMAMDEAGGHEQQDRVYYKSKTLNRSDIGQIEQSVASVIHYEARLERDAHYRVHNTTTPPAESPLTPPPLPTSERANGRDSAEINNLPRIQTAAANAVGRGRSCRGRSSDDARHSSRPPRRHGMQCATAGLLPETQQSQHLAGSVRPVRCITVGLGRANSVSCKDW